MPSLKIDLVVDDQGNVVIKNTTRNVQDLKSETDKLNSTFSSMASHLGTIGGLVAGGFSVGAIGAFVSKTLEAKEELVRTAEKVGLSSSALQVYRFTAQQTGVEMDKLTNGMGIMARNMSGLSSTSGAAQKAFDALGLSTKDSAGNMKSTEQMLGEIADKFAPLADGSAKTALAMGIFGRSGKEMIPFLNEGTAGIEAMRGKMQALGFTLDDAANKRAAEAAEKFQALEAAFKNVGTSIVMGALPAIDLLASSLMGGAEKTQAFSEVGKTLGSVLLNVAETGYGVSMIIDKIGGSMTTLMAYRAKVGQFSPFASSRAEYGQSESYWRGQNDMFASRYAASQKNLDALVAGSLPGGAYLTPGASAALGLGAGKANAPTIGSGSAVSSAGDPFKAWSESITLLNPMLSQTGKELERLVQKAKEFEAQGHDKKEVEGVVAMGRGFITQREQIERYRQSAKQQAESDRSQEGYNKAFDALYEKYGDIEVSEYDKARAKLAELYSASVWDYAKSKAQQIITAEQYQAMLARIDAKEATEAADARAKAAYQQADTRATDLTEYYKGRAALSLGSPAENVGGQIEALQTKLAAIREAQGAPGLSGEEFQQLQKRAEEVTRALTPLQVKMIEINGTFSEGIRRGLGDWLKNAQTAYGAGASMVTALGDSMTRGLENFFDYSSKGFLNWQVLVNDVLHQVYMQMVKTMLVNPAVTSMMGGLSGLFGGGSAGNNSMAGVAPDVAAMSNFHSGGLVGGSGGASRLYPAYLLDRAPRYHSGLAADETAAILQKGETVIPRGGGMGGLTNVVNINAPQGTQVTKRTETTQFDGRQWVKTLSIDLAASDLEYQSAHGLR